MLHGEDEGGLVERRAEGEEERRAAGDVPRRAALLPVDGVLMRLARTQAEAGKATDAEQTFNKLVQEFPDSPFAADARKELDQLKKRS